jgi:hypothetical protein
VDSVHGPWTGFGFGLWWTSGWMAALAHRSRAWEVLRYIKGHHDTLRRWSGLLGCSPAANGVDRGADAAALWRLTAVVATTHRGRVLGTVEGSWEQGRVRCSGGVCTLL